ncbi:MAG: hypothetical protein AAF664_16735 [Planctomycetota bacterium]
MSVLLAESPWTVVAMLFASGLLSGFVWLQTGRKLLLLVAAVAMLLIPGAFFWADSVETDREALTRVIHDAAAAVEQNDADRASSYVADESLANRVRQEMARFTFEVAKVGGIRSMEIIPESIPPSAQVTVSARIRVSGRNFKDVNAARLLDLSFQKRDDRWVVTEYDHRAILGNDSRTRVVSMPGS